MQILAFSGLAAQARISTPKFNRNVALRQKCVTGQENSTPAFGDRQKLIVGESNPGKATTFVTPSVPLRDNAARSVAPTSGVTATQSLSSTPSAVTAAPCVAASQNVTVTPSNSILNKILPTKRDANGTDASSDARSVSASLGVPPSSLSVAPNKSSTDLERHFPKNFGELKSTSNWWVKKDPGTGARPLPASQRVIGDASSGVSEYFSSVFDQVRSS